MVLPEDREDYNRAISGARRYVAIARQARLHGDASLANRSLAQAVILRGIAWRFAKHICGYCWKEADLLDPRPHVDQAWCRKCFSWIGTVESFWDLYKAR